MRIQICVGVCIPLGVSTISFPAAAVKMASSQDRSISNLSRAALREAKSLRRPLSTGWGLGYESLVMRHAVDRRNASWLVETVALALAGDVAGIWPDGHGSGAARLVAPKTACRTAVPSASK